MLKKHKFLLKKGRMNAEKRKQIEQIESLTEEKSERMRLSDAGVERRVMQELNGRSSDKDDGLALTMCFLRKVKE